MTTDLSLYHIDQNIAQLIQYWEEREADTDAPMDDEERLVLDGQIKALMEARPEKVSGVCAIFRQWDDIEAATEKEIERLRSHVKAIQARRTRLKEYVAYILEQQPEPKRGCRKLTGVDGSVLMLKGNGGKEPLLIQDPAMVPDEQCDFLVTIPGYHWRALECYMRDATAIKREPSNSRIREALAQPCDRCGGLSAHDPSDECDTCGGSGKNAVPGAALGERGVHVEIR